MARPIVDVEVPFQSAWRNVTNGQIWLASRLNGTRAESTSGVNLTDIGVKILPVCW
jgi:hypothetical protein